MTTNEVDCLLRSVNELARKVVGLVNSRKEAASVRKLLIQFNPLRKYREFCKRDLTRLSNTAWKGFQTPLKLQWHRPGLIALGSGVFYGFYHQSTIYARDEQHKKQAEFDHQKSVIDKAKVEWAKKTAPKEAVAPGGVISDPNDPKFDLEAYLKSGE
ncbi:uncharacterized protein KY384_004205 [Bacidia gigantensis]|uniref:uncharacterized protein n=1 Tax=Bacidia gigantensis TaxID=2732470 RepID=UPI001D036E31|nr:uncharacterized protein KY384_004205 [Bacidia gigantensis]KAG8530848.1 hypothetical protein KY384_004205 [Bacidia gigantensis]